jgi:leucyl aminopeptidase
MPVTLAPRKARASRPVHLVAEGGIDDAPFEPRIRQWARDNGFSGQDGRVLVVPGEDGSAAAALFGVGPWFS